MVGHRFSPWPVLQLLSQSLSGSLRPPHYNVGGGGGGGCSHLPRDVFVESCRHARVTAQVEAGSGFGHEKNNTRPADVLISNWSLGNPAAVDLTITSPLNSTILSEAGVKAGSAAQAAECRKHQANDTKCSELGWSCVPQAVETYGCWGVLKPESL